MNKKTLNIPEDINKQISKQMDYDMLPLEEKYKLAQEEYLAYAETWNKYKGDTPEYNRMKKDGQYLRDKVRFYEEQMPNSESIGKTGTKNIKKADINYKSDAKLGKIKTADLVDNISKTEIGDIAKSISKYKIPLIGGVIGGLALGSLLSNNDQRY